MCHINLISYTLFDDIYKDDTFMLWVPGLFFNMYKLVICEQL